MTWGRGAVIKSKHKEYGKAMIYAERNYSRRNKFYPRFISGDP